MPVTVTPRAIEVLRRALEAGRMDPAVVGVRIAVGRGLRGDDVRTTFAEQPEPDDETLDAGGVRIFVAHELASREVTVDVADEHDRIVLK